MFVKPMLEARGLPQGYSWRAFFDIFEENYFPSGPFQVGFDLLMLCGMPKPWYRTFELLHRLGTELIHAMQDSHPTVEAWVVRRPRGHSAPGVLTNFVLPRHPIVAEHVHASLDGMPPLAAAITCRIDTDHCNPRARWQAVGSPRYLDHAQIEDLAEVSRLAVERQPWTFQDGMLHLELDLPPHAVASIVIDSPVSPAEPVSEPPIAST